MIGGGTLSTYLSNGHSFHEALNGFVIVDNGEHERFAIWADYKAQWAAMKSEIRKVAKLSEEYEIDLYFESGLFN